MTSKPKLLNTITKQEITCLNCKSNNLVVRGLGLNVVGVVRAVTFGNNLFEKSQMIGIACEDCGVVFLMLKKAVESKE